MTANPLARVPETAQRKVRWRVLASLFGGLVLGLVLLVAAWAKTLDPVAFTDQIQREGLDFLFSAGVVTYIALALEIGLGLALVFGIRRPWVLIPAALLVAFFVFLTGRTWYRTAQGLIDPAENCGCFGNLVERTPKQAFWQDLLLMVPALGLAFLGWRDRGPFPKFRVVAIGLLTVAGLLFAWKAPTLPLDNLATVLKPGVAVGELCFGQGEEKACLDALAPELEEGEYLLVIADIADERFLDEMAPLNDYALAGNGPRLLVLTAADYDQQQLFFLMNAPSFELRETPEPLLQKMMRKPPRSFLVRDGRVEETFSGYPPFERW